jgi:hypothetical protein
MTRAKPARDQKVHNPLPNRMKVEQLPDGVLITRRWHFNAGYYVALPIGVLLILFGLFLLFGASLNEVLGGSIFVMALGLLLLYPSLAHLFNSTRINPPATASPAPAPPPAPGVARGWQRPAAPAARPYTPAPCAC